MAGMVKPEEKDAPALSNEGIKGSLGRIGAGMVKGLNKLTQSQASKEAEAADAERIKKLEAEDAEYKALYGIPKPRETK